MSEGQPSGSAVRVLAVGGPTALVEYGGLRLLTDPTFDPPGAYERPGRVSLHKLAGPALSPDELGRVDAVLLSHDHHEDNLDHAGRAFLPRASTVLTTAEGAARLGGNAVGLEPWDTTELERPGGGTVTVTAVRAQHGPDGTDHLTGPVIGFVLTGDGVPSLYVSGDNASVDVVREIVGRLGGVELALLFAGAARVPHLDDILTLSGARAAEVAAVLGARVVVPLHYEGWAHFSEGIDEVRDAFAEAGLAERLVVPAPGEWIAL